MTERGVSDMDEVLYSIGAVLNSPRACMRAASIVGKVDFMCLNAEDLTTTTFGCSMADSEKFIPLYLKDSVYHVSGDLIVMLLFSLT
jgi:pyruvate,orthophosphate dikinase